MESTLKEFSLKQLNAEEDLPGVLKLVEIVSIVDNPFRQMVSVDIDELRQFYSLRAEVALAHNASFGFYEKSTGNLVGMFLNSVYRKSDSARYNYDLSGFSYCENIHALLRFFRWFNRDIFEELNTDCYMDLGMVAVDPMCRRHGLADAILKESEKFARMQGVPYTTTFSVTEQLYAGITKRGYSLLRKGRYQDYVDSETGKALFATQVPPDAHSYILFKKIEALKN